MSNPEIIVQVSARDNLHLLDIIETHIAPIDGILTYEITMCLELLKFGTKYSTGVRP